MALDTIIFPKKKKDQDDMAGLTLRAEDALQNVKLGEGCVKYLFSIYLRQIGGMRKK